MSEQSKGFLLLQNMVKALSLQTQGEGKGSIDCFSCCSVWAVAAHAGCHKAGLRAIHFAIPLAKVCTHSLNKLFCAVGFDAKAAELDDMGVPARPKHPACCCQQACQLPRTVGDNRRALHHLHRCGYRLRRAHESRHLLEARRPA